MAGIEKMLENVATLSLTNCNIGPEGAKVIAKALKHPNCKVSTLYLRTKKVGVAGTKAIAEALKHPNCKITVLYMSRNEISDESLEPLGWL